MFRVARLKQGFAARWARTDLYDLLALAAFVLLAVLVLLTFDDYAVSNDETVQHRYAELIIAYYTSGFTDLRVFNFENLYLYGGLFDIIAVLSERLLHADLYDVRHVLCAFIGIGGIAATCVVLAATVWAGNRAVVLLNENRQVAAAASMALSGEARAAERLYATALARAPWDHESGVALASLLLDDRRPAAALDALDRADAWTQSRESWLARAHALLLRHDTGAALQVMEQATAAVPDFLRAEMLQARLAASMGRKAEAKAAWHQVLLSPQRSARARQLKFEAAQAWARHAMYAADPVMAHQTATSQAGK